MAFCIRLHYMFMTTVMTRQIIAQNHQDNYLNIVRLIITKIDGKLIAFRRFNWNSPIVLAAQFTIVWHSTLTMAAFFFVLVYSLFFRNVCKHPDFMSLIMTNGQCCERAMTSPFVKLSQKCDIYTQKKKSFGQKIKAPFDLHRSTGQTQTKYFDFSFYVPFLTSCSDINNP